MKRSADITDIVTKLLAAGEKQMSLESLEAVLTEEDRDRLGRWARARLIGLPILAIAQQKRSAARALRERRMSVETARALQTALDAVRTSMDKSKEHEQTRTVDATVGKRKSGTITRQRVLKLAEKLKHKNPRLSKVAVARSIAKMRRCPCGYEQARAILNSNYDRDSWKKLR